MPADEYSERVLDSERRDSRGILNFISHTNLAKQSQCQYLKDDTLIFRVSVVEVQIINNTLSVSTDALHVVLYI